MRRTKEDYIRRTKEERTPEEGIALSLGVQPLQSLGYKVSKATGSIASLHVYESGGRL